MRLPKNIGTADRILRCLIALALFVYAIIASSLIAFLLSLFVFFEAVSSWCLFYQLVGKNTCPISERKK